MAARTLHVDGLHRARHPRPHLSFGNPGKRPVGHMSKTVARKAGCPGSGDDAHRRAEAAQVSFSRPGGTRAPGPLRILRAVQVQHNVDLPHVRPDSAPSPPAERSETFPQGLPPVGFVERKILDLMV
jgi:hypothetical protein